MMKELDEILYDALTADTGLMDSIEGRIESTCFEVSPEEQDNTKLPYLIVMDDGLQNTDGSKDTCWESEDDRVQASVGIAGRSPREVKQLRRHVRKAIARHIRQMAEDGEEVPELQTLQSNDISWDWIKPCYHTTLSYVCFVDNHLEDDEQYNDE